MLPDAAVASRSFWSGTISFGLVSVAVEFYAANRQAALRLRMLGPQGQPLKRQYVCSQDGQRLGDDELIRGFEIEPGRFVTVTDEELEALEPEKSRDIDLSRFVPRSSVSPAYFDRAYFLVPAGSTNKAYHLLAETMERSEKAGIGTFVMRGKAYVMAIFAERGILHGQTLRFFDELRTPEEAGLSSAPRLDPKLVAKMKLEISKLSSDKIPLEPLKNEHSEALRKLAEGKLQKNLDVVHVHSEVSEDDEESSSDGPSGPMGKVIDLMEKLRQNLGAKDAGPKTRKSQTATLTPITKNPVKSAKKVASRKKAPYQKVVPKPRRPTP